MTYTNLGDAGTMLADTPVGLALCRATDAATSYLTQDVQVSAVADEMAKAITILCHVVLDVLTELGVTEMG